MKRICYLALLIGGLQCIWLARVGAVDMEPLRRFDIVSLNRLGVHRTNGNFVLTIEATFLNQNPEPVRLRNMSFEAQLSSSAPITPPHLKLGRGQIAELQLPAAQGGKSGLATNLIEVVLGPETDTTVDRMIHLWNIVGDPTQSVELQLKGRAEFGKPHPKGWVYSTNRIEAELTFMATTQRQVLLY